MKRLLILLIVMACVAIVQAENSGGLLGPNQKTPSEELAWIEAQIASAKEAGNPIDPTWLARVNELIPLIKGHPANIPVTYRSLEDDGFGQSAIIRPQELSPLEQRIQDLEMQLMNGFGAQADDETFRSVKEQLGVLYAQRPINRERNPLDQGADACPATAVTAIPYTDTGTTATMSDNYDLLGDTCGCCGHVNSRDVIYSFSPPFTGSFTISLCGSSYDTYMWVNTGGACPGNTQVACNDDACGLQSSLTLTLLAGTTYYIVIDGYNNQSGAYVLNISGDCAVECVAGDLLECAGEFRGAGNEVTDCDGGCDNSFYGGVNSFQTILPFQTVCGRSFTYTNHANANFRDVDAYQITLTEACSLSITVRAEFGTQVFLMAMGCPWNSIQFFPAWSHACSTVTYISQCLQPGTYRVVVVPTVYSGLVAMYDYRLRVDLVPCNGCVLDGLLTAPGSLTGNTCDEGNDCNLRPSEELTFAVFIPYASDWTFSLCGSAPGWDPFIYLTQSCCASPIRTNDDGCGSLEPVINCVPLSAGVHYLTVEGYSVSHCGEFELNVSTCIGSCCYGDLTNPSCSYTTNSSCTQLGGVFTLAEPCSSGACYTRPTCSEDDVLFSQLPSLPDEPWDAWLSDNGTAYRRYEDFSVTADIVSVKFWGVITGGEACVTGPRSFEITFIDSVNNVTQTANVNLVGTVLNPLYFGTYQIVEFFTFLVTPCTITDGWIRIVEMNSANCSFYWSTTILGNGTGSYLEFNGATPTPTNSELAFCLGAKCGSPDSVTIELYPGFPDAYIMRWWQPAGFVNVWWSTNPNAVFPQTYSAVALGYRSEGSQGYSFYSPDVPANEMIFRVTLQCGRLLTAPEEQGDIPIQVISSPFGPPAPAQR